MYLIYSNIIFNLKFSCHVNLIFLGVKPDYGLKSEYLTGDVDVSSAAEMHAVAAAAGLGQATAASAAPLPTLMHMGYGAPHHQHAMLASNHQEQSRMCSYLQHRSAW